MIVTWSQVWVTGRIVKNFPLKVFSLLEISNRVSYMWLIRCSVLYNSIILRSIYFRWTYSAFKKRIVFRIRNDFFISCAIVNSHKTHITPYIGRTRTFILPESYDVNLNTYAPFLLIGSIAPPAWVNGVKYSEKPS